MTTCLFNESCNKVCNPEKTDDNTLPTCNCANYTNGVSIERPWSRFNFTCPESVSVNDLNMRRKAEVLKYKKNSSKLTKKQRYSLASRNLLTKKKSWATQTQGKLANPNTSNLIPTGILKNNFNNSENLSWKGLFACCPANKIVPPVPANLNDNDYGTCDNTQEPKLYSTTQSDVPGKPMLLKLDENIPLTLFPPIRRVYKSGGTKWPQFGWSTGSKGFPVGKKGQNN